MERVVIELPARWIKFSRSPASVIVPALIGLSLAFAPLFLFMLGKEGAGYRDPRVVACFVVILLFPLTYIRLATLFINQVRAGMNSSGPGAGFARSKIVLWPTLMVGAIALYFLLR